MSGSEIISDLVLKKPKRLLGMNRRICSNCIGNAAEKKYYELTDSDSRRINILKVWLTIMVVFIHSYSADIRFSTGTVSVQMPC